MKKVWLWGLAIVLGLVLALPAMATDWSATGWIGSTGAIYENIPGWAGGYHIQNSMDEDVEHFWSRARLKLTARANEDLYGVLYFEMDSTNWGETGTGRNHMGTWGADQTAVEVKNVFVDFKIPGISVPVWARVGIQPYALRPHFLLYRDAAGVTVRSKVNKVTLSGGWAKAVDEDLAAEEDDVDVYFVQASGKVADFSVGGYWLYQDTESADTDWHWVGFFVDGKVRGVKLTFDFAYNFGETDDPDVDYSGYYLRGVASYVVDKFEVGFGGHYASELDASDLDDYTGFLYPTASEAFAGNNDSVIFGGWFIGFSNQGDLNMDAKDPLWPLNTWGLRAFAYYQALDWLKLGAQVAYWADNVEDADWYGTDADDDDDIGWEFDVGAKVKVYKNLTWGLAFGYLVAGDALDQAAGSPDDPWAFVSNLVYTF